VSAVPLDDLDRALLGLLTADGRTSYADLARETGLSTSAVHQRVRRLESKGVITGYTAKVDPVAAGLPLAAFISLTPIDPAVPDDAPERLTALPAVTACHSVAGSESWILQVRVAGPAELEQLLTEIRTVAGVSTHTTVVLSTAWEGRTPPPAADEG
jgi:Lrp/AsnC family transcriptional regulator, leucine-responsive regulatory protein